ncbi:MAG: Fis family transcriptional regulator [Desulfobacca sp. 4484_104]|nr:MAG: Fis family transcriptional regulator [Desulfobacca sp. 4484_104]RLA89364.1 MAG: sigma-54-dependent Fis family transcriptional regulator [Deltaproteobacteria bacterium]
MAKTILVVDDEPNILSTVSGILQDEGFEVLTALEGETAHNLVAEESPDLVLLDIALPGQDGLEILKQLKGNYPLLPVVMLSAYGSVENAVQATRLGAYDFIEKPPHADKIILTVRNALEMARLTEENLRLRQKATPAQEIIGKSPAIQTLREQVQIVAPTNAWVLITGENGTGKELVARAIHRHSKRRHKAFVEVNCAAIPEELIESELFGHEKGAFTGAASKRRGKFDQAHEGTLFLDEIGDMSLKTQAKVLRILQEQRFERVGGSRPIQVDVRVIAATNKNLEEEIERGTFRADLYYRINVIPIQVPPLRERRQDIPLLIEYFLKDLATEPEGQQKIITPEAVEILQNQPWPGNVRELKNCIQRLAILSHGWVIDVEHLPRELRQVGSDPEEGWPFFQLSSLKEARARFEREFIRRKLAEYQGSVSLTAEAIGLERSHLYKKMRAYGLDPGLEREASEGN